MNPFSRLLSPKEIGGLRLKNRIIMAPIDTNLANEKGEVTEALLAFYQRRANGGAAMLIVENSQVDFPIGKNTDRQLSIHDDNKMKGLTNLSEAIHQGGALAALQIHHAGRETTLDVTGGHTPVAPSPIPCAHLQTPVRELKKPEIEDIIHKFMEAAVRAKKSGFDLVEIHGAHGYLIGEFLSPHTNKRMDEYGGNFQGRLRFARNIVVGIKETLGKDFPVSFRFSADEFIPGGLMLTEGVRIARELEKKGVDVLHVSAGIYESLPKLLEPMSYAQGWRSYLAAEVKKAVGIPVITVGVIREPKFAEEILSKGMSDFIAIGRGLLADPDWPKKAAEGNISDIKRCIGCNIGCLKERLTKAIQCSVNPETGREAIYKIIPIKKGSRMVTIVGGGPAGLEAARMAALRGFKVTLFEKNNRLGGQMCLACLPPGKDKIRWTIEYYEHQMEKLDIDVRLSQEATVEKILGTSPHVIILAPGSFPRNPPGGKGTKFVSADVALSSAKFQGLGKAVVVGGGGIGCETALFLHHRGLQVTIFEQLDELAQDVEEITAWDLKQRIKKAKIDVMLNCRFMDLENDKLILEIWTDGSITPDDALAQAAKIIKDHMTIFINFEEEIEDEAEIVDENLEKMRVLLSKSVDELELSVRSYNTLKSLDVSFLEQLVQKSEDELRKSKHFSEDVLREIKSKLEELHLSLGLKG